MSASLHNQAVGKAGEEIAAKYISSELGMQIIERNWRKQSKEIDLIAIKDNKLRIVEVKSRVAMNKNSISASLNEKKLRDLAKGASLYVSTYKLTDIDEIFFDLVVVTFEDNGEYEVEYIPRFFYPRW